MSGIIQGNRKRILRRSDQSPKIEKTLVSQVQLVLKLYEAHGTDCHWRLGGAIEEMRELLDSNV